MRDEGKYAKMASDPYLTCARKDEVCVRGREKVCEGRRESFWFSTSHSFSYHWESFGDKCLKINGTLL